MKRFACIVFALLAFIAFAGPSQACEFGFAPVGFNAVTFNGGFVPGAAFGPAFFPRASFFAAAPVGFVGGGSAVSFNTFGRRGFQAAAVGGGGGNVIQVNNINQRRRLFR